jgi:hypothetical protein
MPQRTKARTKDRIFILFLFYRKLFQEKMKKKEKKMEKKRGRREERRGRRVEKRVLIETGQSSLHLKAVI